MLINGKNFTVGADPELFIGLNGKPHSAFGLIEGDKRRPTPVKDGAVQVDGMALEFNIDPADNEQEFVGRINSVQSLILEMTPGFQLIPLASVVFDKDHFDAQPDCAKILGCDPDFSGLTMAANRKPNGRTTMRTAGGHVHVGGFFTDDPFDAAHFYSCGKLARLMDEQVGVYSVLFDLDDKRRSMYGAPSCFRPKKYGMEYRTMSNAWIFNSKITSLIYNFTLDAVRKMFDRTYEIDPVVHEIIQNSDRNNSFFKNNHKAELIMEAMG